MPRTCVPHDKPKNHQWIAGIFIKLAAIKHPTGAFAQVRYTLMLQSEFHDYGPSPMYRSHSESLKASKPAYELSRAIIGGKAWRIHTA